jgi:hypothetical protein
MRPAHGTMTPTTGTVAVTAYCASGFIRQIFLKATTGSTTFDVTITDANSDVVFTREDETGELNEYIDLPTYPADYVLTIANASVDESFSYKLLIDEPIYS